MKIIFAELDVPRAQLAATTFIMRRSAVLAIMPAGDLRAPIRSAGIRTVYVSSPKVPIGSSAARLRRSYSRRSWSRGLKACAGIFSCRTRDPG